MKKTGKKRYVNAQDLGREFLDGLWSRGLGGCVIYVPLPEEAGVKEVAAVILSFMEDDYEEKGRTFLGPDGRPHRARRMSRLEAGRRLGRNPKTVSQPWRRAVDRWNRWFRDREAPGRSRLLDSIPDIPQHLVLRAYLLARRAARTGGDPRAAAREVLPSRTPKEKIEKQVNVLVKAARDSIDSGPLRPEERMPSRDTEQPRRERPADAGAKAPRDGNRVTRKDRNDAPEVVNVF